MKSISFKETKPGKINLELDPDFTLNEIKEKKPTQCCFKKRMVDGFLIGATRSYFKGRTPKNLSTNSKEIRGAINIAVIEDKEDVVFYLQVIAYIHLLDQAGRDEEKKKEIHKVLMDISQCSKIAEGYFKGGWEVPEVNNFKEICTSNFPDTELFDDLDIDELEGISQEED